MNLLARAGVYLNMEPDKRELRKLKKTVKRAGSKHRRRAFKRDLVENPEETAHTNETFGRSSSAGMNGLDCDATRRREDE